MGKKRRKSTPSDFAESDADELDDHEESGASESRRNVWDESSLTDLAVSIKRDGRIVFERTSPREILFMALLGVAAFAGFVLLFYPEYSGELYKAWTRQLGQPSVTTGIVACFATAVVCGFLLSRTRDRDVYEPAVQLFFEVRRFFGEEQTREICRRQDVLALAVAGRGSYDPRESDWIYRIALVRTDGTIRYLGKAASGGYADVTAAVKLVASKIGVPAKLAPERHRLVVREPRPGQFEVEFNSVGWIPREHGVIPLAIAAICVASYLLSR